MKKLLIMRGPQAVGKTSFLAEIGLATHTLSSDSLRLAIAGPIMAPDGGWGISQENNDKVWMMFADLAKQRMSRGETLALDAMFRLSSDIKPFMELATEHGYEVAIVDFSTMPKAQAQAQNKTRVLHAQVSDFVLDKTYANFEQVKEEDLAHLHRICWDDKGRDDLIKRVEKWLTVPTQDFSHYEKVVHIGDLQGCFTVLTQAGGPFEKGFDDNTRYIFVGDLVDRGIENGALLKWLIPHAISRDNIDIIWGNHEDHLFRFSQKKEAFAKEFRERTLPQLIEAGVTSEQVAQLLAKAKAVLPYVWNGKKVVVTHAGLPGLPPYSNGEPQWHLVSTQQLTRGSGNFSDPIDKQFERNTLNSPQNEWTQVHGHRNQGAESILATARSINLEDEVEFGGNLRLATLSSTGWEGFSYRNSVYASWRNRFEKPKKNQSDLQNKENEEMTDKEKQPLDINLPIPHWIREPGQGTKLPDEVLSAMRAHSGVLEKPMPTFPHISSLNFTRDVFFDKKWDDVVVKARGLFFNTETGEVVARGYEKFFNIEERPETEMKSLEQSLSFPITGYVKENGYLGNIGYDAKTDSLFIASKSTASGDFAAWFREIFDATVPADTQDRIRRYLRDAEVSMVFEVIDPVRDPHMIDYPAAKLVLLDVFHRSSNSEKLNYDDLKKVGSRFNLEVKRRAFEFRTFEAFKGWHGKATKDLNYRHSHEDIEGIVFEDQKGFQTKAKLPHYSFWKIMRSTKDRYIRLITKKLDIETQDGVHKQAQAYEKLKHDLNRCLIGDTHPLALSFMKWCSTRPVEELKGTILELRKKYNEEVGISPEHLKTHWGRFDPSEKEPVKKPKEVLTTPSGPKL